MDVATKCIGVRQKETDSAKIGRLLFAARLGSIEPDLRPTPLLAFLELDKIPVCTIFGTSKVTYVGKLPRDVRFLQLIQGMNLREHG
jgi:hypothetical protein